MLHGVAGQAAVRGQPKPRPLTFSCQTPISLAPTVKPSANPFASTHLQDNQSITLVHTVPHLLPGLSALSSPHNLLRTLISFDPTLTSIPQGPGLTPLKIGWPPSLSLHLPPACLLTFPQTCQPAQPQGPCRGCSLGLTLFPAHQSHWSSGQGPGLWPCIQRPLSPPCSAAATRKLLSLAGSPSGRGPRVSLCIVPPRGLEGQGVGPMSLAHGVCCSQRAQAGPRVSVRNPPSRLGAPHLRLDHCPHPHEHTH